jgi:hypothetical protein
MAVHVLRVGDAGRRGGIDLRVLRSVGVAADVLERVDEIVVRAQVPGISRESRFVERDRANSPGLSATPRSGLLRVATQDPELGVGRIGFSIARLYASCFSFSLSADASWASICCARSSMCRRSPSETFGSSDFALSIAACDALSRFKPCSARARPIQAIAQSGSSRSAW